jgi:hypothetical protein
MNSGTVKPSAISDAGDEFNDRLCDATLRPTWFSRNKHFNVPFYAHGNGGNESGEWLVSNSVKRRNHLRLLSVGGLELLLTPHVYKSAPGTDENS